MFKLFLFIFASGLMTTFSLSYEIQPAVVANCDIFNHSGLTCSDCETLTRCVVMNGVWHSFDVEKCDTANGFHCNSFEQQCSNSMGPCHRSFVFTCSEEGYFPNPFTCQEYYSCVKVSDDTQIVPFQRFCDSGTAYSPATKACTLNLHDPACITLQWQCNFPGDLGLWPGTDDIFYVCLRNIDTDELIPELHKCLYDQIFDGSDCVARNTVPSTTSAPEDTSTQSTTESSTDVTTSSDTTTDSYTTTNSGPTGTTGITDTSSTSSSTGSTTTAAPFTCSAPGLFPNPNNCTQYFVCDNSLSADLQDCPNGTYFVPNEYACVWGSCIYLIH